MKQKLTYRWSQNLEQSSVLRHILATPIHKWLLAFGRLVCVLSLKRKFKERASMCLGIETETAFFSCRHETKLMATH